MSENKVALVTGSARRIGASIVSKFHSEGFDVIVHARSSTDAAQELIEKMNSIRANSANLVLANLTETEKVEELPQQALQCFGRIDVLVNNASAFYPTPIQGATQNDWDELFSSNVRAAYFLCQELADELINNEGAIVNIVDTHADNPLPNHSIYNMAKAALKTMTKSLAKDLGPNVRVNGVSPGAILWPTPLENEDVPEIIQAREKIVKGIPLSRLGDPEDIAAIAYFLAIEASYMTGQVIKVDGGRSLN